MVRWLLLCTAHLATLSSVIGFHPIHGLQGRGQDTCLHSGCDVSPERLMVAPAQAMPARWLGVPDCDRPKRWRSAASASSAPRRTPPPALRRSNYKEHVAELSTTDDFHAAVSRASAANQIMAIKFYSNDCKACGRWRKRLAVNYRRLATTQRDDIVCYEAELGDAKALFSSLRVKQVPSLQIISGNTRLLSSPLMPATYSEVEAKIGAAIYAKRRRREGLLRALGEKIGAAAPSAERPACV